MKDLNLSTLPIFMGTPIVSCPLKRAEHEAWLKTKPKNFNGKLTEEEEKTVRQALESSCERKLSFYLKARVGEPTIKSEEYISQKPHAGKSS